MTAPARAHRKRPDRCGRLICQLKTCLAAAIAVIALAPPAATAQTLITLVPVQDQVTLRGPTRAEGVVIWSHGRSVEVEDSLAPTPEYIGEMRKAGWDTFRFNRLRAGDTLPASGAALATYAEQFKAGHFKKTGVTFASGQEKSAADDLQDRSVVCGRSVVDRYRRTRQSGAAAAAFAVKRRRKGRIERDQVGPIAF